MYMVEILDIDLEDGHQHRASQNPAATTWLISFRQISSNDSLAADCVRFMSIE